MIGASQRGNAGLTGNRSVVTEKITQASQLPSQHEECCGRMLRIHLHNTGNDLLTFKDALLHFLGVILIVFDSQGLIKGNQDVTEELPASCPGTRLKAKRFTFQT